MIYFVFPKCQSCSTGLNQFVCGLLSRWILPSGVWKRQSSAMIPVSWSVQILCFVLQLLARGTAFCSGTRTIIVFPYKHWASRVVCHGYLWKTLTPGEKKIDRLLNLSSEQWFSNQRVNQSLRLSPEIHCVLAGDQSFGLWGAVSSSSRTWLQTAPMRAEGHVLMSRTTSSAKSGKAILKSPNLTPSSPWLRLDIYKNHKLNLWWGTTLMQSNTHWL